jgi:hypothetical protein
MRRVFILVLMLTLTGCIPGIVSAGHEFDMSKAEALTPGVSTIEDAKTQVGQPFSEENNADGTVLVKWVYGANGVVGVHEKGIAILFGPDHKMIRVTKRMDA